MLKREELRRLKTLAKSKGYELRKEPGGGYFLSYEKTFGSDMEIHTSAKNPETGRRTFTTAESIGRFLKTAPKAPIDLLANYKKT